MRLTVYRGTDDTGYARFEADDQADAFNLGIVQELLRACGLNCFQRETDTNDTVSLVVEECPQGTEVAE